MTRAISYKIGAAVLGFLILLSSIAVIRPLSPVSASNGVDQCSGFEFRYTLPQLTQIEQKTPEGIVFYIYSFENCQYLSESGRPHLPFTTTYVHVPTNAKNIHINIVSNIQHEQRVVRPIYPSEKQIIKDDNGITSAYSEFYYDEEFYAQSEEFYPVNQVEIAELGNLRNYRYLVVNIYPLQYQTKENILRVTDEISLQVTWDGEETTSPQPLPPSFQNIINGLKMLNTNGQEPTPDNIRDGQVQYPTDLANITNKAEYLIITADQFLQSPSLANIAIHRAIQSGFDVAVVKTSDIYTAIGEKIPIDPELDDPGDGNEGDLDLSIKTFVKYVYNYWNNGARNLQYVLLVGDPYPPTASFYLPFHTSTIAVDGSLVGTDYWYSCINDDNEDGLIDDSDDVADLIIGRFSVQTEPELVTVVGKTISYERYPPMYPEQEWGTKVFLGHANGNDPFTNPMREIRNTSLLPYHREVSEVYADEYPDYPAARDALISEINAGHALFAQNCHGGSAIWEIGTGTLFTTDNVSELQNAERQPIVISLSCWTGMFDYSGRQSLAEVFVNTPGKGSVAFLGSSRPSYQFYQIPMFENFLDFMNTNEVLILGNIVVASKLGPRLTYHSLELYNLLGDPALDISNTIQASDKPELTCTVNHAEPQENTVVFNVTVNNSGLSSAEDVVVELFINQPSEGAVRIEEATHTRDISAETTMTYDVTVPLNEEWNDHTFFLTVDRLNNIDELCENNSASPLYVYSLLYVNPYGPYMGFVNSTIQLNCTVIGWFPPYNYTWLFDDGLVLYGQNPQRNYSTPGDKMIVVRVRDSHGYIKQEYPWAQIADHLVVDARGPYTGFIHEQVNFLGLVLGGFMPYNNITWEFGDGTTDIGLRQDHIYDEPGIYILNLTVNDSCGFVATDNTTVTIGERSAIVWVDDNFTIQTPGYGIDHFTTIGDGIESVLENGTVYVLNGTYYENLWIDRSVTIHGCYKESTIIDGDFGAPIVCFDDNIHISGLTCTNGNYAIVVYYANNGSVSDCILIDSPFGIAVYESSNQTISHNIIRNDVWGCHIAASENISVLHNLISNNYQGIVLSDIQYSRFFGNDIRENTDYGLHMIYEPGVNVSTNTIYHNNLIDNTQQVYDECHIKWDAGYPLGGNYWSDYSGIDRCRGPHQQEIGSDGIGDTSYDIDGYIIDRFPFIQENGWDAPRTPQPYNYQGHVSVSSILSWTWTGFQPVSFDVYFGTTNPPTTKVSTNQTIAKYNPGTLIGNTKYFWKIVTWDGAGHRSESQVWCFKTAYSSEPGNIRMRSPL